MKRLALILLCIGLAAPLAQSAENVDNLVRATGQALNAKKYDEVLSLSERIITEHPEAFARWGGIQFRIAATLAAKGDLAEAVKAAHIAMDCASTTSEYDSAVMLTAGILSALDQNVERANQLLSFQQTGPVAGAVNPLEAIGYPSSPERERAFAVMRQEAGESASGSRLRAYTYLLSGKPSEAFAHFADAFRRSATAYDTHTAGIELVTTGLRAVRGHRLDQNKALRFLLFGPCGPDGKPNTEDDLADPFAGLLPAPPVAGEGGLAGLNSDEIKQLRQLRDAAKLYVGDPMLDWLRRPAAAALQRANEALEDWGSAEQKAWYLQQFFSTQEPTFKDLLLTGALAAARGRALHLGGIPILWNEIDAYCASHGIGPEEVAPRVRKQWTDTAESLNRLQVDPLQPRPLTKPATFGNAR